MTWIRSEASSWRHAKMVLAKKRADATRKGRGDSCTALYDNARGWSAENGTDGYIPREFLSDLTSDPEPIEIAEILADAVVRPGGAGLLERREGGYQIHDYLEFNPSAAEEAKRREAAKGRAKSSRDGRKRAPHAQRTHGARDAHETSTHSAPKAHGDGTIDDRSPHDPSTPRMRTRAPADAPPRAGSGRDGSDRDRDPEGVQGGDEPPTAVTPPDTMTPTARAVLDELRSHRELALVANPEFANRLAPLAVEAGSTGRVKLAWMLGAIGKAATKAGDADAAGEPLRADRLASLVRAFCTKATADDVVGAAPTAEPRPAHRWHQPEEDRSAYVPPPPGLALPFMGKGTA